MPRSLRRLSARLVAAIQKPGHYADGGGLYLVVRKSGLKQWVFISQFAGQSRELTIGPVEDVSLAEARKQVEALRSKAVRGISPFETRQKELFVPTFGEYADDFLCSMADKWRNDRHRAQWKMTLTNYAAAIRSKPVNRIETADVLTVLTPIWHRIPTTALRLRSRIERILEAARANGYRSGENPARWRGHLDSLLPSRKKLPQASPPMLHQ